MTFKVYLPIAMLLTGCATASTSTSTSTDTESDLQAGADHAVEIQVFFTDACPIGGTVEETAGTIVAAIVGDVVGKLAANGVDALGKYLSADKAVTFTQSTRMDGFVVSANGTIQKNPTTKCVVLVAGNSFGKPKPLVYDPLPGKVVLDKVKQSIYDVTKLSGTANFYMELGIRFNSKNEKNLPSTAFTYEPKAFYYPSFIIPSGLRYSSRRDVFLQLEISQPGESEPFAAFDWQWSGIKRGGISEESVLNRKVPWSPLPEGIAAAGKTASGIGAIPIFPVNIKLMLTETAKPHVILKYIGEALIAQKAAIVDSATSSATQAISEQARINARQAASENVKKKYVDYTSAYDVAKSAQAKFTSSTDTRSRQQNFAIAKQAYLDLDLAEASVRLVYGSAGIGAFSALEPLPKLPEKI